MIYFYKGEVKKICEFLNADESLVLKWLEENKTSNKYIEFQLISGLGQEILSLQYGKNKEASSKVVCQVSGLGTHFK